MDQREIIRDNVRELYRRKYNTELNRKRIVDDAKKKNIRISNGLLQRIEECSADVRTSSLKTIAEFFEVPVAVLTENKNSMAAMLETFVAFSATPNNEHKSVSLSFSEDEVDEVKDYAEDYFKKLYAQREQKEEYPRVIGTARLGPEGYYFDLDGGNGFIEHKSAKGSIAIHVRGNSMHPAIRDGWYIIVEPDRSVHPSEYVLVTFNDGRKMVKELLFEKPDCYVLLSVNGEERITAMKDEVEHISPVSAVVPPSKHRDF